MITNLTGLIVAVLLLAGQYAPVTKYDPKRDAARDIDDAIAEARQSGRNVLLEIGGEWCSWCHTLDRYFDSNKQIKQLRDDNFVTVKVNWSPENENRQLLSRYGNIQTFPFFVVLDRNGKMLQAQRTGFLEKGSSYNDTAMTAFLKMWSPGTK